MDASTLIRACLDDDIPGAVNFRDLGGLPAAGGRVRTGQLFRSGMTHGIDGEGFEVLRARYRLRTVIDFRGPEEQEHDGLVAFVQHGIGFHHLPVYAATALTPDQREQARERARDEFRRMRARDYDWAARYRSMVADHPGPFVRFVDLLAEAETLPAVFHCSAGRDRTGVAAALVLGLLGVSDDDIAADYACSGAHLRPHAHRFDRIAQLAGFAEGEMAAMLETEAEDMYRFLEWLRSEHGGPEKFLTGAGAGPTAIDTLRRTLVGPA